MYGGLSGPQAGRPALSVTGLDGSRQSAISAVTLGAFAVETVAYARKADLADAYFVPRDQPAREPDVLALR